MNIYLNNIILELQQELYKDNNIVYASICDLAKILNINRNNFILDSSLKILTINIDDKVIVINYNSITYNNELIYSSGYIIINTIRYLPVKIITETLSGIYNEQNDNIYIEL